MVFLTPDDDMEREGTSPFAENNSSAENAESQSSELDNGQLSVSDSISNLGAADKVELDLEDAPFLEEEEEEEEATAEEQPLFIPTKDEAPAEPLLKRLIKNRLVVYGGGAGLLLILVTILLVVYFWPAEELIVEEEQPPVANETITVEEVLEEPEVPLETVTWDPFWVEYITEAKEVRFLHAKFSTTTKDKELAFEISRKQTVLRDAIFYYLRNKDLTFLANKENVEALKRDLLSVINQYLTSGQLNVLLIEEYLIK